MSVHQSSPLVQSSDCRRPINPSHVGKTCYVSFEHSHIMYSINHVLKWQFYDFHNVKQRKQFL